MSTTGATADWEVGTGAGAAAGGVEAAGAAVGARVVLWVTVDTAAVLAGVKCAVRTVRVRVTLVVVAGADEAGGSVGAAVLVSGVAGVASVTGGGVAGAGCAAAAGSVVEGGVA